MPSIVRRIVVRMTAVFRRAETDRGIDDELRYHLERETERLDERGVDPNDARIRARRSLGNATAHAESARQALRWLWLQRVGQDARDAVRPLRATPACTL